MAAKKMDIINRGMVELEKDRILVVSRVSARKFRVGGVAMLDALRINHQSDIEGEINNIPFDMNRLRVLVFS